MASTLEKSHGFWWHSNMKQQYCTLRTYRQLMSVVLLHKGVEGVVVTPEVDDSNDALIFPDNGDDLITTICNFLILLAAHIKKDNKKSRRNSILGVRQRRSNISTKLEAPEEQALAGIDEYISMMNLVMDFAPESSTDKHCPLCAESPFRTEKEKDKVYRDITGLNSHLRGPTHTLFGELKAQHESLANEFDVTETHPYRCQYGCGRKFDKFTRLVGHFRREDPLKHGEIHDMLRRQDGWHDDATYPVYMTNGSRQRKRVRDKTGELLKPPKKFMQELLARPPNPFIQSNQHLLVEHGTDLLAGRRHLLVENGTDLLAGRRHLLVGNETNLLEGRKQS
ncbi:hypothetical protein SBOR_4050 [Sclerotinia borealis F-4128]|uniref:C2H2-type domain-containing protein n=1 Tax=Sclerotinia borealis (strain F-4128) TaxID=1432307 RepID=W9CM08_SCLBF|nr:hypothetical protein SBOR_4050 [Sclerotinia borealis F-4128]